MTRTAKTFIAIILLAATAVAQTPVKLDGKWWRTLYEDDRIEFVAGFIDCYANDFGDKNNTFSESWYTYAPRINTYYEQHPSQMGRKVTSVLFDVRSKHPPKPLPGGETWTEKHGFFNGGYWLDMSSYNRAAFIEGYLACHRQYLSSRPQRFSKPAAEYEKDISLWYGVRADDTGKINLKREKVAIADALYRFADAPR